MYVFELDFIIIIVIISTGTLRERGKFELFFLKEDIFKGIKEGSM